jgi:hypothetical protein
VSKILAGPKPGEKLIHEMFSGVTAQKLILVEGKDAEGKPTGVISAKGVYGKADEPTGNNRIYPRRLLEREVAALQKQIQEKGGIIGELDHPADGKTSLKRVSHVITKLEMQPDGTVVGESKILDTEYGKTLKEIVKSGCAVGVSSRGQGSVTINESGQEVVQEDFHLVTYDFVAEPASASAYPTFMMENKNRREAEMADEKKDLTVADLKANHKPLVEAIEADTKKAAEEAFAKRTAEIRAEERNLAKDELREAFKKEIIDTLAEQRAEIEKQVRSEVMSDPKVARSQKVMETIKTVLRPLITDEDISAEVKAKDEEITKLKAQIAEGQKAREEALAESAKLREEMKKIQEQVEQVEGAARDMGYKLFLERSMQGMTKEEKALAMNFVGDLKAIKTAEDLKAKFESAKTRAKEVLAEAGAKKDAVRKTFEEIEKEVAKLEAENAALKGDVAKLTEGMEKAVGAAKSLGLQAYAERKIAEHPRRPELRKLIESKFLSSKEEVDKLVGTLTEERRTSESFRQIREGLAKGQGRKESDDTTPAPEKNEVMGVSVSEMRRLSGLNK